ncbi:1542_t:CDS:1, partial [Acaulospora morrowiae]
VQLVVFIENESMDGALSFAQFPNLMKITFSRNIKFTNLDSIDISKNEKLWWLYIDIYTDFMNTYCMLLVKEKQLDQVIVSHGNQKERMKNQCKIPYCILEDRKLEQLEAEVQKLNQDLAEKSQQIKDLQTETKRIGLIDSEF